MWYNKTMPRSARVDIGGEIYHVINRANGRLQIFNTDEDYKLFEQLLLETKEIFDMRMLAYELMPTHFHLLLYPKNDSGWALAHKPECAYQKSPLFQEEVVRRVCNL